MNKKIFVFALVLFIVLNLCVAGDDYHDYTGEDYVEDVKSNPQAFSDPDFLQGFNKMVKNDVSILDDVSVRDAWLNHFNLFSSDNLDIKGFDGNYIELESGVKVEAVEYGEKIDFGRSVRVGDIFSFENGRISLDRNSGKILAEGGLVRVDSESTHWIEDDLGIVVRDSHVQIPGRPLRRYSSENDIELSFSSQEDGVDVTIKGEDVKMDYGGDDVSFEFTGEMSPFYGNGFSFKGEGEFSVFNSDGERVRGVEFDKDIDFYMNPSAEERDESVSHVVRDSDGNLHVVAKDDTQISVENLEGYDGEDLLIADIVDESKVIYAKDDSEAVFTDDDIDIRGMLSDFSDVRAAASVIDSDGAKIEMGRIFDPELIENYKEAEIRRELLEQVKKNPEDTVAVLISQEDYDRDEIDLEFASEDSQRMQGFLHENGVPSESIHTIEDASRDELLGQLEGLQEDNPGSQFFLYYSGHGFSREAVDGEGRGFDIIPTEQASDDSNVELPGPSQASSEANDDSFLTNNHLPSNVPHSDETCAGGFCIAPRDAHIYRSREDNSLHLDNVVFPEDFNSIFSESSEKPIYFLDSCHSGGFCRAVDSPLSISSSAKDQSSFEISGGDGALGGGITTRLVVGEDISSDVARYSYPISRIEKMLQSESMSNIAARIITGAEESQTPKVFSE